MPNEATKVSGSEVRAISYQAARWLIRLDERDMSWREHLRYLDWLQRSPAHFEEMRSALRMRGVLDDPRVWAGLLPTYDMQKSRGERRTLRRHRGARRPH